MSRRSQELASRRDSLRASCAMQRRHLAESASVIKSRLGGVDRGIGFIGGLVRNPVVVVGATALLVLLGPKRLVRFLGRGVLFASTAQRIARIVR